jgi:hypothetical protein
MMMLSGIDRAAANAEGMCIENNEQIQIASETIQISGNKKGRPKPPF